MERMKEGVSASCAVLQSRVIITGLWRVMHCVFGLCGSSQPCCSNYRCRGGVPHCCTDDTSTLLTLCTRVRIIMKWQQVEHNPLGLLGCTGGRGSNSAERQYGCFWGTDEANCGQKPIASLYSSCMKTLINWSTEKWNYGSTFNAESSPTCRFLRMHSHIAHHGSPCKLLWVVQKNVFKIWTGDENVFVRNIYRIYFKIIHIYLSLFVPEYCLYLSCILFVYCTILHSLSSVRSWVQSTWDP